MSNVLIDRIVMDFTTPVPVSVLTVLFPFKTLGERLEMLSFYCLNLGADPVTFLLEGSETGVNIDPNKAYQKTADATQQVSFDLSGVDTLVTNWRLSAYTASPGFPVTTVQFRVKAQVRQS